MKRPTQVDPDLPPDGSRFAVVGIVAAALGVLCTSLLCVSLVAGALGRRPLLWSHSPGTRAFFVTGLWVAAALAAIVCGFIALVMHYRARFLPVLAMVVGAASLLVVPATALAAAVWWASPHPPSDSAMLEQFGQHRSQFEQALATGRSPGHLAHALRRAGIKVEDAQSFDHAVLLTVTSWGLVPSGLEKGYAYSSRRPRPLTTGDSQRFGSEHEGQIVYRHISGPWYIYYYAW